MKVPRAMKIRVSGQTMYVTRVRREHALVNSPDITTTRINLTIVLVVLDKLVIDLPLCR